MNPQTAKQPAPVTTLADANALIAHCGQVMDALLDLIQQETELVRAGHLAQKPRPSWRGSTSPTR